MTSSVLTQKYDIQSINTENTGIFGGVKNVCKKMVDFLLNKNTTTNNNIAKKRLEETIKMNRYSLDEANKVSCLAEEDSVGKEKNTNQINIEIFNKSSSKNPDIRLKERAISNKFSEITYIVYSMNNFDCKFKLTNSLDKIEEYIRTIVKKENYDTILIKNYDAILKEMDSIKFIYDRVKKTEKNYDDIFLGGKPENAIFNPTKGTELNHLDFSLNIKEANKKIKKAKIEKDKIRNPTVKNTISIAEFRHRVMDKYDIKGVRVFDSYKEAIRLEDKAKALKLSGIYLKILKTTLKKGEIFKI